MKYVMLLATAVVLASCSNRTNQEYMATISPSEISTNADFQADPGKELMEQYCYACHNPTAPMEDRLAPPMIAIKRHYLKGGTTKEEFTAAILEWVMDPSEEKSKMPGALNRFGVMPYQKFSEETIVQISHYLYENEIDKPVWFDEHHRGRMGRKQ